MNGGARLTLGAAMLALAAASSACSSTSTCSRDEDHIDVWDGFVNEDRTMYSSVDPEKLQLLVGGKLPEGVPGPPPSFTHFPANRVITFHIGLRDIPVAVPYLSFSPDGDATIAPCAGNQCLIRKRTKDVVVLRNDTCSDFYVWLTATTSATPFHGLTDAGVDDGATDADSTGAAGASGEP